MFVSERASEGSWLVRLGGMEDPSHDVRICVVYGLTKHPLEALWDLICWQRNSKSGR